MRTSLSFPKPSKLALAIALMCASAGVGAQAVPATDAADPAKKPEALEVIIVNATKRPDPVQKVPLAITVVTEEQLRTANIQGFSDLVKVSPSLTLTQGDQPGNSTIYLRGIGTTGSSVGIEPSVAVQIDEVPAGFRQRVFTDLMDIERIEVLRGPQSTLYGQSAGLINITTKPPSEYFQARVSAGITSDQRHQTGLMISGPISATFGYRISASFNEWDGNITNNNTGHTLNGNRDVNSRAKLVWTPNAKLSAALTLNYNRQDNRCCATVLLSQPPTLATGATYGGVIVSPVPVLGGIPGRTLPTILPGIEPGPSNRNVNIDSAPYQRGKDFSQAFKVKYELGQYEIAATLANSRYYLDDSVDQDTSVDPTIQVLQTGYTKSTSRMGELRLTSPSDGKFRFIAGLFGDHIDSERYLLRTANAVRVGTANRSIFGASNYLADHYNRSFAAYSQADWEFAPATTLTAGLRVQKSKISYGFINNLTKPPSIYPNDPARNFTSPGETSDSPVTGRVSVQHQFNPLLMLYASYATGYKNGAYDLTSSFSNTLAGLGSVKPEKSQSYEIGAKTQFFDNKATFNVTAFSANYDNFQARRLDSDLGLIYFSNIPKVRTRGFEIDSSARLFSALRLNLSAAFTRAISLNYPGGDCYPLQTNDQGCIATGTALTQNLSGKTLPNSPKWKVGGGLSYDQRLNGSGMTANFAASYVWQSAVNFTVTGDPLTVQPAYGLLNLSATIRDTSSNKLSYTYGIYVNNVADKDYSTSISRSPWFYTSVANPATRLQGPGLQRFVGRDSERYVGFRVNVTY
jgi:iron complex outermembrane recepter protein